MAASSTPRSDRVIAKRCSSPQALYSFPASPPSPIQSHLISQLRQEFAGLADKDHDTRRRSMEVLRSLIEWQLDAKTMPSFLEQIASDGLNCNRHAISLLVDVVRTHKQAVAPIVPCVMAAVKRCIAAASGNDHIHRVCARVVAAVARYVVEPAPSASSAQVFYGLSQPLLESLCGNVESTAVGSAICMKAMVESENWKYAPVEIVTDVCNASSICVVDKGKKTVAHLQLLCTLIKIHASVLQGNATSLLRVAAGILHPGSSRDIGSFSWQLRTAASQLMSAIFGCFDHRFFESELLSAAQALHHCRHDKAPSVRKAVREAIATARHRSVSMIALDSLGRHGYDLEMFISASSSSPTAPRRRPPVPRRKSRVCRRILRPPTVDQYSVGSASNGSNIDVSRVLGALDYSSSSSPCCVTKTCTEAMTSASSVDSADCKPGRPPLYPMNQWPVTTLPIADHYDAIDDNLQCGLTEKLEFAASKENVFLLREPPRARLSQRSEELYYIHRDGGSKVPKGSTMDFTHTETSTGNLLNCCHRAQRTFEEEPVFGKESSDPKVDLHLCDGAHMDNSEHSFVKLPFSSECGEDAGSFLSKRLDAQDPKVNMRNCKQEAEDFLIFSASRSLVRYLRCIDSNSWPDPAGLDADHREPGWSVRDNPVATNNGDVLQSTMHHALAKRGFKAPLLSTSLPDTRTSASNASSSVTAAHSGLQLLMTSDIDACMRDRCRKLSHGHNASACCCMKPSEEDLLHTGNQQLPSSEDLTRRRFRKTQYHCMEAFVLGALSMVLVFSIVVAVLGCMMELDNEPHTLLPT